MTCPFPSWSPPPEPLILGSDEVHVWRAFLGLTASCVRSLQHTLSPDEQARAERFYFERDRERFIVARAVLRDILARYLKKKPGQLRFCYNPHGKPALAGQYGREALCFNVSHADGVALYAVTRVRELGVDLEHIRPDLADEQIARRFFSARELAELCALPAHLKPEAFFTCWTRKEAYVKAKGEGLSIPLDQFDVSLAKEEPAALLRTAWDPQEASRWSLQELTPGADYVAALAVEGHHWRLKCWQWPG